MKKVFSVSMSLLFLLISSQQALIIMHFKLHQEAIEQAFCVNIDSPELECNGSCYLHSKLQEAESTNPENILIYKTFDLVLNEPLDFDIQITNMEERKRISDYLEYAYTNPYLKITVPPPISNS